LPIRFASLLARSRQASQLPLSPARKRDRDSSVISSAFERSVVGVGLMMVFGKKFRCPVLGLSALALLLPAEFSTHIGLLTTRAECAF